MTPMIVKDVSGSFRDPSGYVFTLNDNVYRYVDNIYKNSYDHLIDSGLYDRLIRDEFLIPHHEAVLETSPFNTAYKILKPQVIPFISYPYEWCFSQLKDAADLTLKILKVALDHNMTLKDGSAFNIQFFQGKPIFIDTLSFDVYKEGSPWIALRQFCQHFLAPLALMKYKDLRLNQLSKIFLDGIPLDLASRLLPPKSYFNSSIFLNLHVQARFIRFSTRKQVNIKKYEVNKKSLYRLIDLLATSTQGMNLKSAHSEWSDYSSHCIYTQEEFQNKAILVEKYLNRLQPTIVWDIGSNDGHFSRRVNRDAFVLSLDSDPLSVEFNYLKCKAARFQNILPLVQDLCNPSPGIGWNNNERGSMQERGKADVILALALLHHIRISNNVPFPNISETLSNIGKYLIIEYVPKEDPMSQKLLCSREDIFSDYCQENFENIFLRNFSIIDSSPIGGLKRTLYLMRSRKDV